VSATPRPSRAWRTLTLLATLVTAEAGAQDAPEAPAAVVRIEVTVTAVAAQTAYLDKGREDHIEPGDAVVLRPPAGAAVKAVVRSVARNSCRVELAAGADHVAIGDRGEVIVPAVRFAAPEPPPDEHPPWTADDEGYDPSQPLLAAPVTRPEDRPVRVHGRYYLDFAGTWDSEQDSEYQLWRTGVDVTVENPFADGGEAHFVGELFRHDVDLASGPDDTTNLARPDRASYLWGGTRERPDSFQVGRFLQSEFPELGVIDGVEASHRLESGGRVGASFGYLPEWFPDMRTGQDLQAAVFYRRDADERSPLSWGLAYQNTWHEGAQDRNLFVADFDAALAEDVTLSGEALVDYYGPGGDELKGDGPQLTEAHLAGNWRLDPHAGVGVRASRTRWPEEKRDEFGQLSPEQVQHGHVTRYGVNGWKGLGEHWRLDARVDGWTDEDQTGSSGDVRATLSDLLWKDGDLVLTVFGTHGEFTEGRGVRLAARSALGVLGYGSLSWETADYESDQLGGVHADTEQQALRASLDSDLGRGWSLSLYAERRTGDGLESTSLGLFLQESF
jgi:hypothetical protein